MAIDINRRNAFAHAFRNYPDILESFTRENVWLEDPKTGETRKPSSGHESFSIMQVLLAQFLVRMIKTRAGKEPTPEMAYFGFDAVTRYHKFRKMLLGNFEIMANTKYREALKIVEQNIAEIILSALAEEAALPDKEGEAEFDEADFWHDVALSFVQNQKVYHPLWAIPVQEILSDHLPEFRKALAA